MSFLLLTIVIPISLLQDSINITIIKRWKEQKQVIRKHRAKVYTEAQYFALNIGRR